MVLLLVLKDVKVYKDLDVIHCPAWASAEQTPGPLAQGGGRRKSCLGELAQTDGATKGGRA